MAEYDGSIRINTEISTEMAKKSLGTLSNTIVKTAKEISSLRSKMDALKGQKFETQEYKDLKNDAAEAKKELSGLLEEQKKLPEALSGLSTEQLKSQFADLNNEIEKNLEKLARMDIVFLKLDKQRVDLITENPEADLSNFDKEYDDFRKLYEEIRNRNSQIFGQTEDIRKALDFSEKIDKASASAEQLGEKLSFLEKSGKAFTLGEDTQEYSNYERQLQYEQAALEEATKQYQALDKLKDPYGRLSQALTDLNGKLSSILRPIQKIQSAFAQDIKVSGYEKLQSSLGELGGIAIRVAETVKNTFATLKQGKKGLIAVIHSISSSLLNMANTVNSAIGSVLGNGLEKLGEGIGAVVEKIKIMASGIGSAISSAAKVVLGKLAGLVGSGLNLILHPFKTLKNVATTTLGGIANIIKGVLGSALEGLKNRAAGLAATIINGIAHPFQTVKSIASGAISATSKLLSGMVAIAKKVGSAIKNMASMLKKAVSSMSLFGKSTKSANNPLQAGFKNILRYGLGIRSLYALINKLRTAIKEGFTNMANEVDGFKAKVDSLQGSTLTLKNSFAAAFRPLVEVAIPYIQMVADALSNLLDMVGQFTAAITGQKTYTKAIKQTTAAIEDENAAQNKQLSGLDKLNNLSSGSGGNSDSGASTQMFEENVPISNRFADIAQQLKDMWESADFSGLGETLGNKLKSALENIPWDSIKQTIAKAGKSFATLINGIVDVPGLALDIGKNIGEAINTGITGINAFLDNTHWDSVGIFIGESLNGIIDSINWGELGHLFAAKWNAIFETIGNIATTFHWTDFGRDIANSFNTWISDFEWAENGARLGELAKGLLDSIISFLENAKWQELGNNVADFIGSIDWTGIFERLAEGIGAALGGLAAFLWGLIEDAWNDVSAHFLSYILESMAGLDEDASLWEIGWAIIQGMFNGIIDTISTIGTWIYEHIFQPFIDGFKNAFGIHSPSTVMAELGGYLMEGLLNGIQSLVDAVTEIWEFMKEIAISLWESVKEGIAGIINGIKTVVVTVVNAISSTWTTVWNAVKSVATTVWNGIKTTISTIINGISSVIQSVMNVIKSAWTTVWNAIKTVASTVWNGIKTTISTVINGIKTAISTALNAIKAIWNTVWTGLKTTVVNIFNGIWTAIKSVINSILGGIEGMANGVIRGINSIINSLNALSFTIPATPFSDEMNIGLNIPNISEISIPRLATGAVIPANKEFLAVLGDQKSGTNIEAPLDTIKQALREEAVSLGLLGGNSGVKEINLNLTVECEGYKLLKLIQKLDLEQFKRTQKPSFQM